MARSALSDFETLCKLGSGSFGTVYKVRRVVDNAVYVIKDVRIGELSFREQEEAINEVNILAGIDSPYIVGYFDSFIEEGCLHIVMEYCNRGDLQALVKKAKSKDIACLKEDVTWNLGLQVILGLDDLHQQRILHRDLKSANVFLQKDDRQKYFSVKIGDLGVAKLLETSTAFAQTIVGTPYYLSPELVKDEPYREKSDCWALGVLLYECCTLCHPFEARNQCALIMKIIQSPVKPPPEHLTSPELCKLVLWLLQKNAEHRPNIRDILREKFVQEKLIEHGFPLPDAVRGQPTTDVLTSVTPLEQGDGEGAFDATAGSEMSGVANAARNATNNEKYRASEDWTSRANQIYADENDITKAVGKTVAGDTRVDSKHQLVAEQGYDPRDDKPLPPDLRRASSGPASFGSGSGPGSGGAIGGTVGPVGNVPRDNKMPKMPIRKQPPLGVNAAVRGDRTRGGPKAQRVASSRALTRHQVQAAGSSAVATTTKKNTYAASSTASTASTARVSAVASSVAATAIATAVDERSQNKVEADNVDLGMSFKAGDFSAAMHAQGAESNLKENTFKPEAEAAASNPNGDDFPMYEEDFEPKPSAPGPGVGVGDTPDLSRAESKREYPSDEQRDSQDATVNLAGAVSKARQTVSRINSAYSDTFEEHDASSPALCLSEGNTQEIAEAPHIAASGSGSDSKATITGSNTSTGTSMTSGSVHTLISNPNSSSALGSLAVLGGPGGPPVVVGGGRERRRSFDSDAHGYDDDFEDYDDDFDNLYQSNHTDTDKDCANGENMEEYEEEEEGEGQEALSEEYLAHFGKDTTPAAEPKQADYLEDDFKASLRLTDTQAKLDVKGAEDSAAPTHPADSSDISNGAMSNDSLEHAGDSDGGNGNGAFDSENDMDSSEARSQIDEMLYWISDTRDILKSTLGPTFFDEIYHLCKENMQSESAATAGGGNVSGTGVSKNPSYLNAIQKKLQEHLNASLEGVLGTVMQVKALLAWEDELARRNHGKDAEALNFLKAF